MEQSPGIVHRTDVNFVVQGVIGDVCLSGLQRVLVDLSGQEVPAVRASTQQGENCRGAGAQVDASD
jgi:hypothetical protein